MVLSSQMARPGTGRKYMSSVAMRKRKSAKLPWVIAVVVILACVGGYFWWNSNRHHETSPTVTHTTQTHPSPASTAVHEASTSLAGGASATQPHTPAPQSPTPAPTTPDPVKPLPQSPVAPTNPTADANAPESFIRGMRLIADGKLVDGRALLSDLYFNDDKPLSPVQSAQVRDILSQVNQKLLFSREAMGGDPLIAVYTVEPNDRLANIAPKYNVPYHFIETINKVDARRIWVGQKLKMVNGPFHVIVDKSDFRLDVYALTPDSHKVYVCSLPVGLGEGGSTPVGPFKVVSRLENPGWTNPRTNQTYPPNDPKNPIGHYWLGLEGTDTTTQNAKSYGIHGTIEPDSIGKEASMGCVRLRDDDIKLLYSMLYEGQSNVFIRP